MKKSQLKINAERLASTYEKNKKLWANLHLILAAVNSGETVPQWAIVEALDSAIEKTGEVGLDLAEFLDDYYFGGEK